jgi:hypothetical protein
MIGPAQAHPLDGLLFHQRDLRLLCAERPLDWDEYAHMNEFHGNAGIMKRFIGLPEDEPLPFALEHAIPYDLGEAYAYDLNCALPTFLAVNEESAATYTKGGMPSVHAVGFSYLYAMQLYEEQHPYATVSERRGTLVFPDKSTLLMDTDFDRAAFAAGLAALPEEYQPVVVCTYWRDYLRGLHQPYEDAGIPVVSAGHLRDPDFPLRLHDLCRRFRYACANDLAGSFALSILSGCHFFHLPAGEITMLKNGNTNTFSRDPSLEKPQKAACLAASPFPPQDPAKQRELAVYHAGVSNQKTREELRAIYEQAQRDLRADLQPVSFELHEKTQLEYLHRLLPAGIDRDGWMRRSAKIRLTHKERIGAVRFTLQFMKPAVEAGPVVELEVLVNGKLFAHLRPPRFKHLLLIPLPTQDGETVVEFVSSFDLQLTGEPRHRSLRLEKIELLTPAQTLEAQMPKKSQVKPSAPKEKPSLMLRLGRIVGFGK